MSPSKGSYEKEHMQKKNIDSHFLFLVVKIKREFLQKFCDEVIALSYDDMNKLNARVE